MAEEAAFAPGALGAPDAAAAFWALYHVPPPPGPIPTHMPVPSLSIICKKAWIHEPTNTHSCVCMS